MCFVCGVIYSDPLVDFHGGSLPELSGLTVGEVITRVLLGIPRVGRPGDLESCLLGCLTCSQARWEASRDQAGCPGCSGKEGFPGDCVSQPVLLGRFPLRRVGTGNRPATTLLVQRQVAQPPVPLPGLLQCHGSLIRSVVPSLRVGPCRMVCFELHLFTHRHDCLWKSAYQVSPFSET